MLNGQTFSIFKDKVCDIWQNGASPTNVTHGIDWSNSQPGRSVLAPDPLGAFRVHHRTGRSAQIVGDGMAREGAVDVLGAFAAGRARRAQNQTAASWAVMADPRVMSGPNAYMNPRISGAHIAHFRGGAKHTASAFT